jgi:hypothetical protein
VKKSVVASIPSIGQARPVSLSTYSEADDGISGKQGMLVFGRQNNAHTSF